MMLVVSLLLTDQPFVAVPSAFLPNVFVLEYILVHPDVHTLPF